MWMFRVGRRSRWTLFVNKARRMRDPSVQADVESAARDLTPRSGENLSVYRGARGELEEEASVLYAVTIRDRPRDMEYVLIPDDCLNDYTCVKTPSEHGAPHLRERHYEIMDLQESERREELARRVLAHARTVVDRIPESALIARARALCKGDPTLREALLGVWPTVLRSTGS